LQAIQTEGRYSVSKVLAGAYIAAVMALAVTAVLIWRLPCENFGCIGIGVAWFAWVVVFLPILGIGGALRSRSSLGTQLLRVTRLAVWSQAALGVTLILLWVSKNAA
jgi:hypothetical protein